jgi:two-component system phosphate regulon response regulator PhoB
VRELLARIKALIRRCAPQHADGEVELAGLRLDPASHRVVSGTRDISLGPLEFRMLRLFMSHPGRVYTRAQLLDEIWGVNAVIEDRTVDVHVRRLRKALSAGGQGDWIETVRGVGYSLRRELRSVSAFGDTSVGELHRSMAVSPYDSWSWKWNLTWHPTPLASTTRSATRSS